MPVELPLLRIALHVFAKLAGSDVEEGSDTGYFDVEAVGDELVIRAEFNEREREAIHPRE